jgi:hypothetical protein
MGCVWLRHMAANGVLGDVWITKIAVQGHVHGVIV